MSEPNPDLQKLFSAIMFALARAARAAAASFEDSVGHHESPAPATLPDMPPPPEPTPIESSPGSGVPPVPEAPQP